jgi:hypothetical protein
MDRFVYLLCVAFVISACSEDGGTGADLGPKPEVGVADSKTNTGDSRVPPPNCAPVTIAFEGDIPTVSGNPLGLDSSVRTSPVSGSFSYRPCVVDTKPNDPKRGEYDHATGAGAFELSVTTLSIKGSGSPIIEVQDLDPDTFRFKDGPQLLDKDKTLRRMTVDGKPNDSLTIWLSITDSSGQAFNDDALPKTFPLTDIASYTHTFSVKDNGGTLLLQLSSVTQK